MENKEKIKKFGQIFTPERIVKLMLDEIGFTKTNVLVLKIMEPSFGKGIFLLEIIKRIIREGKRLNYSKQEIETIIENNIYGIEIDSELFQETIKNIKVLLNENNLKTDLKFRLYNEDTIKIWKQFENKFDIVVGNPPYVRTKNLTAESRELLKEFNFSKGLQDMYICFAELSYKMLNNNGKLILITPAVWFQTKYAEKFRNFLQTFRNLKTLILIDPSYRIFKESIDICIFSIYKGLKTDTTVYNLTEDLLLFKENINLEEVKFNNAFMFRANKQILEIMKKGYKKRVFRVSNGLGTLKDDFYIREKPIGNDLFVKCLKGSTDKYFWLFFPYDKNKKLLSLDEIKSRNPQMFALLLENKEALTKRSIEDKEKWWAFGRPQGINNIYIEKYSINQLFLDQKSIKLHSLKANIALNAGYFILTEVSYDKIKKLIYSNTFIEYAKTFGSLKNGGFCSLSAKQIELFLNTFYEIVFN